ncbi:hypothetical protein NPIL_392571 [Nephila pilipes]|uniref:Uncharacterized protein n=1 Tax=Nephila pilipes TaxID=299642 RepID=A0A8X6TEP9_NEPPI|nr:hypothetical protein NPIL_392571 [Nephila pilipes]
MLTDEPSVAVFLSAFLEEVHSCKILTELFNFSQMTSIEFGKMIQPYILATFNQVKFPNASEITQRCITPILKCRKKLSPSLVAKVYANTFSKVAFLNGLLNEENAGAMALSYADVMRENAKRYKRTGMKDWKFKTLPYGFVDFAMCLHLVTQENARLVCLVYANEWKLVHLS